MDSTAQVAFLGLIGTGVVTIGTIIVAIINSRKERAGAAESAMEKTLRERITLRDEQIAELRQDLRERDARIADLENRLSGGGGT